MLITNVTALRKNLYGTVEKVAQYNEPVTVTSKSGNVVIVSESDYNAMMETLYLMSQPGVREVLTKAKKADPSEYVDYDPNEEW
ncbi:MAG: type II toxin-antitoxin system Phd/YefM family antitoxin [Erysipelotrichaceae bacterium]|nr:type II toxin-antitoxin system Phd/YefM family antitoxin [Erysipelotrichaceae bacterium]